MEPFEAGARLLLVKNRRVFVTHRFFDAFVVVF